MALVDAIVVMDILSHKGLVGCSKFGLTVILEKEKVDVRQFERNKILISTCYYVLKRCMI